MAIRINAADLHQRVGEILAKIRYTGDRYVVERRGVPVAAVVSIEDLELLQSLGAAPLPARNMSDRLAALDRASAVRRLILAQRRGKWMPDSAETVRQLREERARHVSNLH
ncbi:MAG: type II toxin-antitoxin system prevent-host-death family antitoxin [Anaerolineae bacterium]